jgi:cardiolipin synthase A/B
LNLEANVIIRDRAFNRDLSRRLEHMMRHQCRAVEAEEFARANAWRLLHGWLAYYVTRLYPSWANWLPRHVPRLLPAHAGHLDPAYAERGFKE